MSKHPIGALLVPLRGHLYAFTWYSLSVSPTYFFMEKQTLKGAVIFYGGGAQRFERKGRPMVVLLKKVAPIQTSIQILSILD